MHSYTFFFCLLFSLSSITLGDSENQLTQSPPPTHNQPEEIVIDSLPKLFQVLSTANKYHQYRSLLTYEANGYTTTFKLNHGVENNTVYQQLIFMDGPRRQVFRQQGLSACQVGDTRWGLLPTTLSDSLLDDYVLQSAGIERIANRKAVVFDIVPNDEWRYGYRYSIDQQTGLALKVVTYNKNKIIERLQTASLELLKRGEKVTDDGNSSYTWRVPEVEPCHTDQIQSGWQVGWLPDGFTPVGDRITAQGEPVLVFADGLASVSVFIISKDAATLSKVTARHGATVVVVTPIVSRPDRSIAVVGEVPISTARRIAISVKPQ